MSFEENKGFWENTIKYNTTNTATNNKVLYINNTCFARFINKKNTQQHVNN